MRARLVPVGLAVFALLIGGCGRDLPQLPGQVAANGSATGESKAMAAGTADMMLRANIRYELAKGVTVDAKTGKAYKLSDGSRAATEKLAKALGVKGAVRGEQGGGWSVGDTGKEGVVTSTGGAMYVSKGGSFSMYWSFPLSSSGGGCSVPPSEPVSPDKPVATDGASGSSVACDESAPNTTTTVRPATAPTKEEAQKIATDAMTSGGVDLHDPKITVEPLDDSGFNVRFHPTFDGQTVEGFEAFVTVDNTKTITGANGYLGSADSLGSYDLATLQRAVDRLNESMSAPYATDGRETLDAVAPPPDAATSSGPAIAEPTPGGTDEGEPTVITLTKVEVGQMLQGDSQGSLFLVPAYLFTSDNGDLVTAAAADDKYIEKPTTETSKAGSAGGGATDPGVTANCSEVAPSSNDANGITAQVCASSATVKAGENVVFTITASDPDRAFTDGPCTDGVSDEYGDGGPGGVKCMACATSVAEGPGKVERKREHTYAKAGTYTATFTITSGATCEKAPADSTATLSLEVKVV